MSGQPDPYLIPGTNVLRNKLGCTDQRELETLETDLSSSRTAEFLGKQKSKVEGTVEQLQRIHRYLFQDVYDWAGQIRTVDIHKNEGIPFFPLKLFPTGARYAEETLRDDNQFKGMDRDKFIQRLAVNYDTFNVLHPFREGNGRTQRVFWSLIASGAGWALNWRETTSDQIRETSRMAMERGDRRPLEALFDRIAAPMTGLGLESSNGAGQE
jgi:cell filamentation protein